MTALFLDQHIIPVTAFGLTWRSRPALMTSQCEGWLPNPAHNPSDENCAEPMFVQCQHEAARRIVLDDGTDCYTKKLCPRCAVLQRRTCNRDGISLVADDPLVTE